MRAWFGGGSQGRRRLRTGANRDVIAIRLVGADHHAGEETKRVAEVHDGRSRVVDDPDLEAVDAAGTPEESRRAGLRVSKTAHGPGGVPDLGLRPSHASLQLVPPAAPQGTPAGQPPSR